MEYWIWGEGGTNWEGKGEGGKLPVCVIDVYVLEWVSDEGGTNSLLVTRIRGLMRSKGFFCAGWEDSDWRDSVDDGALERKANMDLTWKGKVVDIPFTLGA